MTDKPLSTYIGNFYGNCDLREKCACLKAKNWHGVHCSHWHPFTASSWEELMQKVKAEYAERQVKEHIPKEANTGTATC